jgi:hypothetical protein
MYETNSYVDELIYENDYFRSYMFCPETVLYIGKWQRVSSIFTDLGELTLPMED